MDDAVHIAHGDVLVVAKAAESSCMADRAGMVVGEVEEQVIHEVDRHLMVSFDVPYVPCLVGVVESLASEETLVLDKDVDQALVHSLDVEDMAQEVAVSD